MIFDGLFQWFVQWCFRICGKCFRPTMPPWWGPSPEAFSPYPTATVDLEEPPIPRKADRDLNVLRGGEVLLLIPSWFKQQVSQRRHQYYLLHHIFHWWVILVSWVGLCHNVLLVSPPNSLLVMQHAKLTTHHQVGLTTAGRGGEGLRLRVWPAKQRIETILGGGKVHKWWWWWWWSLWSEIHVLMNVW